MKARVYKVVRTITESELKEIDGVLCFCVTESGCISKHDTKESAQMYVKELMKRAREKNGELTNIGKNGFIFWYAGKRFIFEVK